MWLEGPVSSVISSAKIIVARIGISWLDLTPRRGWRRYFRSASPRGNVLHDEYPGRDREEKIYVYIYIYYIHIDWYIDVRTVVLVPRYML